MKKTLFLILTITLLSCGKREMMDHNGLNDHQVKLDGYMLNITNEGDTIHLLKLEDKVNGINYMATLKEYYDTLAKPENIGRVYDFRELIPQHEYCPL